MKFYSCLAQGSIFGDLLDKLLDRYLQCCVLRRGRGGVLSSNHGNSDGLALNSWNVLVKVAYCVSSTALFLAKLC